MCVMAHSTERERERGVDLERIRSAAPPLPLHQALISVLLKMTQNSV